MSYFDIERSLLRRGHTAVAGVDEVGRGALFGPVVAAAVLFPPAFFLHRRPAWAEEIRDSKLLTATKRVRLAAVLVREAAALGVGAAGSAEIDRDNIHRASQAAMARALRNMGRTADVVLVDGRALPDVEYAQIGICRGDRKSFSIAAASIVAKVFRDALMEDFDRVYRGFGLARNKGYGTEAHRRELRRRGPTSLHRLSFHLSGEAA